MQAAAVEILEAFDRRIFWASGIYPHPETSMSPAASTGRTFIPNLRHDLEKT